MTILIRVLSLFLLCGVSNATSIKKVTLQIQQHQSNSDSIKTLLAQSDKKINDLVEKESEQLAYLNEIERVIDISSAYSDTLTHIIKSVSRQKTTTEIAIKKTETHLQERTLIISDRLRKLYQTGVPSTFSIILGAHSPNDVLYRIRYVEDLRRYDQRLVDKILAEQEQLHTEKKTYELESLHFNELLQAQQEETKRTRKQQSQKQVLLTKIRSEREQWEQTRKEYHQAQEELSNIIFQLTKQKSLISQEKHIPTDFSFAKQKGKLPWPTNGKVLTRYGKEIHPEYKTITRRNGIDIDNTIGSPVKTVAPGTVSYVGHMRGYGKFVIINHGKEWYTLYAHLDKSHVTVNNPVKEKTIIGTVGETGSLNGPRLYFEIRTEQGGTVDPLLWLKSQTN